MPLMSILIGIVMNIIIYGFVGFKLDVFFEHGYTTFVYVREGAEMHARRSGRKYFRSEAKL